MAELGSGIDTKPVVSVFNLEGRSPIVLVCEHASNSIPKEFNGLGLTPKIAQSHIAWDPGAKLVSEILSEHINAPLIVGEVSRLVYDCNRPPEADDAIPSKSEIFDIPGNAELNEEQKNYRVENFYLPFKHAVDEILSSVGKDAVLVTIHSFTPIYHGKTRSVELGILHDTDARFADAMMQRVSSHTAMRAEYNKPYNADDGVTHTLKVHGISNNILNVMIEIRNDLIATPDQCRHVAEVLSSLLTDALKSLKTLHQIKGAGT